MKTEEFKRVLRRYYRHHDEFEKIAELREPAKNPDFAGGESIREIFRSRCTGDIIVFHKVVKVGKLVHKRHPQMPSPQIEKQYGF